MKAHSRVYGIEHGDTDGAMATQLTEEALRENERSLAITLDSIGDGVISTDREGHITRMNRVAQQLTGWPVERAAGLHLDEVFKIVDGESGASLASPYEAAMCAGTAVSLDPNTTLVAQNGQHHLIEDSVAPILDPTNNSPVGVVLVFRDITQKSRLTTEFQQAKKLETIGRLAGGVAHDFRNLLAGIVGYSEMLQLELDGDPRLQRYARLILETAERAAKLTNQLLAFSRKGKMVSLPVDMHAHIASAVALLQSSTDKRISILTRLSASSAVVMGDPTLLESTLLNLGINARDASSAGGVITVETNNVRLEQDFITENFLGVDPGEYVEIVVSDTGTGMSANVKDHLYEPFFTTKEVGRGTGLGLAAVYGTIKEHHGAITVSSVVDRGTSFKLYLPLCKLSVAEINEEDAQVLSGSGCILLVDDEQIVRDTAAAMLQAIGYEVLLAENGMDALDIYKREEKRIQLVILDVVMPRLSGPDTFLALKRVNQKIKVIFSSGYTFDNGAHELLGNGLFGFIQKPFRRNSLYRVIQETLLKGQLNQSAIIA